MRCFGDVLEIDADGIRKVLSTLLFVVLYLHENSRRGFQPILLVNLPIARKMVAGAKSRKGVEFGWGLEGNEDRPTQ